MKMISKRALGIRFHMSVKILKIIGLAGKISPVFRGDSGQDVCTYFVYTGGGGGGEEGVPGRPDTLGTATHITPVPTPSF
jgi:hypothetical protein